MRKTIRSIGGLTAVLLSSMVIAGCTSGPTKESTGEYVDSSVVSNKVRAAIVRDPNLSIRNIDVTTYKNVVQLSGFVNNEEQKERAGQIARNVEGVRQVQNNISIKPGS